MSVSHGCNNLFFLILNTIRFFFFANASSSGSSSC